MSMRSKPNQQENYIHKLKDQKMKADDDKLRTRELLQRGQG